MLTLSRNITRCLSYFFYLPSRVSALRSLSAIGLTLLVFTSHVYATDVTLAWDDPHNNAAEVGGYNLYYWQHSWDTPTSIDVGKQTTYTLTDLEAGQNYYIAVTAYDSDGKNESDFSNIIDMHGTVFAVNVGGPEYVDSEGTLYEADTLFSGGKTSTRPAPTAGTEDDTLYHSERYGDFTYAVALPNGDYVVTLRFAEIYWSEAGRRRFDVDIEGTQVVHDLDLVAEVGPKSAYDVTIPVQVTDEELNISFRTDVDNAKVSAIKVTAGQSTPPQANSIPVAAHDAASTTENMAVTIPVLANDTDADGDALTVASVTQATNGTVLTNGTDVTYTPQAHFHGADTFSYTVSDDHGGTATGTVSITVSPVNNIPVAHNGTLTTTEDTMASGTLSASSSAGDALTYHLVSHGSKGTVTLTNATTGAYTYTPNPNVSGSDTFSFRVSDGAMNSNTAMVTVTIAPVNDTPVAGNDTATTTEDTAVTISVLANDTDADGDTLTVASITQATNGTAVANGTGVTYTPKDNFHGSDTFSYTVSDGHGGTATGTVTLTVTAENDVPMAYDSTLTTPKDTVGSGTLKASDDDQDTLTYSIVTNGSKGTTTLTDATTGTYTYTPDPDAVGTDSFTFQVNDGTVDSDVATVTVTITSADADKIVFAVNAGGPEYVDSEGTLYEADTQFSGGTTSTRPAPIAGTEDDTLYHSERYGDFTYAVALPNGDYVVTLRFAEIYWSEAGRRRFDVDIEGTQVVHDLDLVAEVGPKSAYDVTIPVQVTDEELNISFHTGRNNATVSAIVVEESTQSVR